MNLDVDVGQVLKNFLNKKKGNVAVKPGESAETASYSMAYYKKAATKCVVIICVSAMISWAINYFTAAAVTRDESEFQTVQQLDEAVAKIEQDTATSTGFLQKNRKKVEEILPMFSDMEGSKTLFKLISNIAGSNNMTIKNLSQGESLEVATPAKHVETKIILEMEGFFQNYVGFKNELNSQKPLLRIDSETIKLVVTKEGERKIQISLNLTDYSINKGEYEKILTKN